MSSASRALWMALGLTGLCACAADDTAAAPPPSRGGDGGAVSATVLRVSHHEVHEQCPLALEHPSVHWVSSKDAWAGWLAKATVLPAPFDLNATDFSRSSILIVALPSTPTPGTVVALDGADAVRYAASTRSVDVRLRVSQARRAPGTMMPMVIGTPCVIAWVPALPDIANLPGVCRLSVHTSEGALVMARTLPGQGPHACALANNSK